jgi:hypothetical protein
MDTRALIRLERVTARERDETITLHKTVAYQSLSKSREQLAAQIKAIGKSVVSQFEF